MDAMVGDLVKNQVKIISEGELNFGRRTKKLNNIMARRSFFLLFSSVQKKLTTPSEEWEMFSPLEVQMKRIR